MAIFSSETGKWKKSSFRFPLLLEVGYKWITTPVACNGTLYWPLLDRLMLRVTGIFAFDPFKERRRVIRLPNEGFSYEEQVEFGRARVGVVGGRLQLGQSIWKRSSGVFTISLKVWELSPNQDDNDNDNDNEDDNDNCWVLVHNHIMKRKEKDTPVMHLLSLLPKPEVDGNDEFLFITILPADLGLYKYQIGRNNFKQISDLPGKKCWPSNSISVFTLVHPPMPTKIPRLACM